MACARVTCCTACAVFHVFLSACALVDSEPTVAVCVTAWADGERYSPVTESSLQQSLCPSNFHMSLRKSTELLMVPLHWLTLLKIKASAKANKTIAMSKIHTAHWFWAGFEYVVCSHERSEKIFNKECAVGADFVPTMQCTQEIEQLTVEKP